MTQPWYRTSYRRAVVDMHITDHDGRFLSQFDPQAYVDMLRLSQAQSAVVYAHSHVGLCYYPTRTGTMHSGLNGRNILAEVVEECHRSGIAVVAYASAIFDTHAYRGHPDWKIIGRDGQPVAERSRYGVCCPNSPYRDYIAALGGEIAAGYDVQGIRFDMTFWPTVCYCRHCRARFGEELPAVVDWEDPRWVAFQRAREAWLAEFAALLTSAVKRANPRLSVEHQASTYTAGWRLGVTHALAAHNDFLQGDFYGDALQGSFARKLLANLSPNRPSGFETCISVDLGNYTALKPEELLRAKAHAALADGNAFIFIDSINPIGTLNRAVYERMGRVFSESRRYEPFLGGEQAQDVAVYFSTESKHDPADNGKSPDDPALSGKTPHVDAAVSACKSLIDHHIPYGVITRRNLGALAKHRVVVLPNVLMMDQAEAEAFRAYVAGGGCLYASRASSLVATDGRRQADFMLADVFGVSHQGETKERFTYIAPAEGWEALFDSYTADRPMGFYASQMAVRAASGAEVLGVTVLPYTDPADPARFASIHNNPPGIATGAPAVVRHRFGAGQAVYAAVELESCDPYREVFVNLIRLMSPDFSFAAQAPKAVEITLFHQPERNRFILNLINFQRELPNIPVRGARVRVRMDGRRPRRLLVLPAEQPLECQEADGSVEFTVPELETFAMLALEYQP